MDVLNQSGTIGEFEYLAKQMKLLKHNKQHEKADEQLDVITREMERKIRTFAGNKAL